MVCRHREHLFFSRYDGLEKCGTGSHLANRLARDSRIWKAFSSKVHGDPVTPNKETVQFPEKVVNWKEIKLETTKIEEYSAGIKKIGGGRQG